MQTNEFSCYREAQTGDKLPLFNTSEHLDIFITMFKCCSMKLYEIGFIV